MLSNDPIQPLVYDSDCTMAAITLIKAVGRSNDYIAYMAKQNISLAQLSVKDLDEFLAPIVNIPFIETSLAALYHGLQMLPKVYELGSSEALVRYAELISTDYDLWMIYELPDLKVANLEYTVEEGDTLWDLSAAFTGFGMNYGEIVESYETHFDEVGSTSRRPSRFSLREMRLIEEPMHIRPGSRILIPLEISEWREVDIAVDDVGALARDVYGSSDFGEIILRLCALGNLPTSCVLPVFYGSAALEQAFGIN